MNRWLRSLIAVTVALAALVVPGSPASADSCLDINKTGWHYAEIQYKPGTTGSMVLDVKAWGTTARTPVQLWHNRINECPSWNQVWRTEDRAGGRYFAIISPNGLCLDQSLDTAWLGIAKAAAHGARGLVGVIHEHHAPEGILARTWPTGSMAFWSTIILAAYLALSYLSQA